jgi:aminoglycoside phosphotransferase (APT) family kinase protein
MSEPEIPLQGGTLTRGVVRVGETVRRPRTDASDFTASLLQHLERVGFHGAPRFRGQDDKNRDILSFIPGETKWRPLADHQVVAGARLLRSFHEATRGTELAGEHAVVCHGDPGPNNAIFQQDVPVAWIDFDLSGPGDPMCDLGYMAWFWCVSLKPERGPASKQAAQVRLLLDAYGLEARARPSIIEAMQERMEWNARFWRRRGETAQQPHAISVSPERVAMIVQASLDEKAYLETHRDVFLAALTR